MKKKLLILTSAFGIAFASNAQTITSANQAPSHGDAIEYSMVDLCGTNPTYRFSVPEDLVDGKGSSNTDLKWDFRNMKTYGTQTTNYINIDSANVDYTGDFPKATLAMYFTGKSGQKAGGCEISSVGESSGYELYTFSGDSVNRIAFTTNTEKSMWFNKGEGFPRYVFPFSVDDTWTENYTGKNKAIGAGEDSVLIEEGKYVATVIGAGSLILPSLKASPTAQDGEQINDVVCVRVTEEFKMNAYIYSSQTGTTSALTQLHLKERYYAWFKEGVQEPVMIYYNTVEDLSEIGGTVDSSNVLKYQPLDGEDPTFTSVEEVVESSFEIYPNPSNGIFNVIFDDNQKNTSVKVYNVVGTEILKIDNVKSKNISINLSKFEKGMYFVKVRSNSNESIQKVIVK